MIKIGVFGKCSECNKILKGETAVLVVYKRKEGEDKTDMNKMTEEVLCLECF